MQPSRSEDASARTVRVGYVGPGMSGCYTSFQHVLRECSGIERVRYTAGDCDYSKDGQRLRMELIVCAQRSIWSQRGPAAVEDLARVDGIIFVADSQEVLLERNEHHLQVLREDLEPFGVVVDDTPLVFALNKADLPNIAPVDVLKTRLRTRRCTYVTTSAKTGLGIMESIDRLLDLIMRA